MGLKYVVVTSVTRDDLPDGGAGCFAETIEKTGIDISFHVDDIYRHARRLVVFDMDSTLIRVEVIDGWRKAEILKTIATVENISLQQTIAILHFYRLSILVFRQ